MSNKPLNDPSRLKDMDLPKGPAPKVVQHQGWHEAIALAGPVILLGLVSLVMVFK